MDLKLVMFKPNGQRKDFPVSKAATVIGRGENCDLQIPLVSVSRRHCEVSLDGEEIKVKDLASSNGTYVNNKRVNESPLKAGDRLVIGPIVFTVQIDGVPEEIKPIKARPVKAAGGKPEAAEEEIVALEADVAVEADALAAIQEDEEEVDPIAALEALAAESKKKKEGD